MTDLQTMVTLVSSIAGSVGILKTWDWWRKKVDKDVADQHKVDVDLQNKVHTLELNIKDAALNLNSEVMSKIGDALISMAETNSGNTAILDILRKNVDKAYTRIDELVEKNNDRFRIIEREFVSEVHCTSKMSGKVNK